jgi:hypothetical protein
MRDSLSGYEVLGSIEFDSGGGRARLVATSGDGMSEPLNFPLESVRVLADTLSFRFAPIGFTVRATCIDSVTAVGTFARPQPPFDSLRGLVRLTRDRTTP